MFFFPHFQTQPPLAPDELSDPNLIPLPTHPGIKYVARALAAMCEIPSLLQWQLRSILVLDAVALL